MEIYLSRHGQRVGPFPVEEINRQLAAGALQPSDLGWCETSPGWKPLMSFVGVIVPGGASSTALPIRIATAIHAHSRRYAGFWIRAAAAVLDLIVLTAATWVIALLLPFTADDDGRAPVVGGLLQLMLAFLYFPAFWTSAAQATLGQRLCRIQVIDLDGGRIPFMRGAIRVVGLIVAAAIFGIGLIMAAFTDRKRGLHDMIAGTFVVKELEET